MQRVTGIGGVFIKSKDVKALAAWYDKHLGFSFGENSYVNFSWVNENNPDVPGNTVFSFFKKESKYFDPSASPFMINFRVKDLAALLETLKKEGVEIVGEMMDESYGKFGWILDPDGNKIELWEPVDDKLG
ncbi:MAG TPA: VOC family protein [Chitinophagaceae bacterium]|nr:VOC family protein [Chitinophagaceae bacterium]